jgi:hypothetical protein
VATGLFPDHSAGGVAVVETSDSTAAPLAPRRVSGKVNSCLRHGVFPSMCEFKACTMSMTYPPHMGFRPRCTPLAPDRCVTTPRHSDDDDSSSCLALGHERRTSLTRKPMRDGYICPNFRSVSRKLVVGGDHPPCNEGWPKAMGSTPDMRHCGRRASAKLDHSSGRARAGEQSTNNPTGGGPFRRMPSQSIIEGDRPTQV